MFVGILMLNLFLLLLVVPLVSYSRSSRKWTPKILVLDIVFTERIPKVHQQPLKKNSFRSIIIKKMTEAGKVLNISH